MPKTPSPNPPSDAESERFSTEVCSEKMFRSLNSSVGSFPEERYTPLSETACQVNEVGLYRFGLLVSSLNINPANSLQTQVFESLLKAGRTVARLRPEDIEAERDHHRRLREAALEREQSLSETKSSLHIILSEIETRRRQLMREARWDMSESAVSAANGRLDQQAKRAVEILGELRNNT